MPRQQAQDTDSKRHNTRGDGEGEKKTLQIREMYEELNERESRVGKRGIEKERRKESPVGTDMIEKGEW